MSKLQTNFQENALFYSVYFIFYCLFTFLSHSATRTILDAKLFLRIVRKKASRNQVSDFLHAAQLFTSASYFSVTQTASRKATLVSHRTSVNF